MAGGKDLTTGRDILSDMLELDPILGVWSFLPPVPNPRYGAGAQPLNGRIYAVKGAARFNDHMTDLYSRDWNATFPDPLPIHCGGGAFCISFPVYRLPIVQSQGGLMSYEVHAQNTVPGIAPITGGTTWRFQAWHRSSLQPLQRPEACLHPLTRPAPRPGAPQGAASRRGASRHASSRQPRVRCDLLEPYPGAATADRLFCRSGRLQAPCPPAFRTRDIGLPRTRPRRRQGVMARSLPPSSP